MAEENEDGQEKTEDPTDERREEFRKRGDIAHSREITSVFVLVTAVFFLSFYAKRIFHTLKLFFIKSFESLSFVDINLNNINGFLAKTWLFYLKLIIPIFIITSFTAAMITLLQTRFNFSSEKLKPDFKKLNILNGLKKLLSSQSFLELAKGIGKMAAVCIVSYLILRSEFTVVPALLRINIEPTWIYWGNISRYLFWSVSALLLLIAGIDYIYNYMTLEKKMKMTKQELKEEYKQRELDPLVKNRLRRMAREISNQRTIDSTKEATVLITNPTHYSLALKYEIGFPAPILIAKGVDFLALQMREAAKESDIPIVENKLLARTLYSTVEVDEEIPQSLFKAVSEVIRYVFKLKGIKIKNK